MISFSLCNVDPDQKEMDEICNAFLGPEVREKYSSKQKPMKVFNKKPKKASKKEKLPESPRAQEDKLTQKCGINNTLICRKTTPTADTFSSPNTPHSPTIVTSKPKSKQKNSLKSKSKSKTASFKSRSRNTGKKKSKSFRQNQISKRGKTEQTRYYFTLHNIICYIFALFRSSKGFVVASAEKRKQLRSYWMSRG